MKVLAFGLGDKTLPMLISDGDGPTDHGFKMRVSLIPTQIPVHVWTSFYPTIFPGRNRLVTEETRVMLLLLKKVLEFIST